MIENFVIGLREGVEASLIIGILLAYLVKSNRELLKRNLWIGVYSAIGASFLFAGILNSLSESLGHEIEELFAGSTSILAVGFVTWMIFWMKKFSKNLKSDLEGKLALAVSGTTVAITAFIAVVREGLETTLFAFSTIKMANQNFMPIFGLFAGIAVAVLIGTGIYRGALRFNLKKFFFISGISLIAVSTNVLHYGVHEFQEFGLIPESSALTNLIAAAYLIVVAALYIQKPKTKLDTKVTAVR